MLVEVRDSKFLRDTKSMALINKDSAARDEYYSKVRMMDAQKEEINGVIRALIANGSSSRKPS